jgi:hypothetical protein
MTEETDTLNYKELYENLLIQFNELKIKLKNYTAPKRNKTFYENHKDEIIQKVKEYRKKTGYINYSTPEQRKEYNKKAYEKRKFKKLLNNTTDNNLTNYTTDNN